MNLEKVNNGSVQVQPGLTFWSVFLCLSPNPQISSNRFQKAKPAGLKGRNGRYTWELISVDIRIVYHAYLLAFLINIAGAGYFLAPPEGVLTLLWSRCHNCQQMKLNWLWMYLVSTTYILLLDIIYRLYYARMARSIPALGRAELFILSQLYVCSWRRTTNPLHRLHISNWLIAFIRFLYQQFGVSQYTGLYFWPV